MLRRPLAVIFLVCALIVAVANLAPRDLPADPIERAEALQAAHQKAEARDVYLSMSDRDLTRGEMLRRLVQVADSSDPIRSRLEPLLYHLPTRDSALYGLGYARTVIDKDHLAAIRLFRQVHDQRMKYLHFSLGGALDDIGRGEAAVSEWQQEIAVGGFLRGAVRNLGRHFRTHGDVAHMQALRDDPRCGPLLSGTDCCWLARQQHDWLGYAALEVRSGLEDLAEAPAVAVVSALTMAVMWVIFFRRVDVFETEPVWAMLLVFLMGALSCLLLVYPLHDLLSSFDPRKETVEDLGFAIGHVGVVEEIVKILPVLLFAAFSREINEPVDYLIYGSMSALGFATVENIGYFAEDPYSSVMPVRFMQCIIGHMTYTGLICYAWARTRYIKQGNPVLACSLAYLVAVLWHGLYDYASFATSRVLALAECLVFGRMLGNALSFSPFFSDPEAARPRLRNEQLIESTALLILIVPFLCWNFSLSTPLADSWLRTNAWSWFLVMVYFLTVESIGVTERRETWLTLAEGPPLLVRSVWDHLYLLARGLLILTGMLTLISPVLPLGGLEWLAYVVVVATLLGVYFCGAYGGMPAVLREDRLPLTSLPRFYRPLRKQPPRDLVRVEGDLAELGFSPATPPTIAKGGCAPLAPPCAHGALSTFLTFARAPAIITALSVLVGAAFSRGSPAVVIPLALAVPAISWPVALGRSALLGAWLHQAGETYALLYQRGILRKRTNWVLWSVVSDGELLTAREIAPWLVHLRTTRLQIFRRAGLAECMERHQEALSWLQGSGIEPIRFTSGNFVQDFCQRVEAIQLTFLATPIRTTLRAARRIVTLQWRHRRPISSQ